MIFSIPKFILTKPSFKFIFLKNKIFFKLLEISEILVTDRVYWWKFHIDWLHFGFSSIKKLVGDIYLVRYKAK